MLVCDCCVGLGRARRIAADVQAKKAAEKAAQEAKDLEMLFSWCRHGKYAEIEEFIQSPDNTLHIDTRDAAGNTLLLVSAQNGNKRIAKLCMRRGADVNAQNVSRACAVPLPSCWSPLTRCAAVSHRS